MSRETWVYPDVGEPYLKGSRRSAPAERGYASIMPDLPDFQSPIDGKWYSGRAGMREHNVRHDVVPTADCEGLPTTRPTYHNSKEDLASRKERLIHEVNQRWKE